MTTSLSTEETPGLLKSMVNRTATPPKPTVAAAILPIANGVNTESIFDFDLSFTVPVSMSCNGPGRYKVVSWTIHMYGPRD